MTRSSSCVICGNDRVDEVRMALTEWREPVGKEIWSTVPRCVDRAACRSRVETVLREPWPVADGTPDSVLARTASEDETEPVAEEVIPWLAG